MGRWLTALILVAALAGCAGCASGGPPGTGAPVPEPTSSGPPPSATPAPAPSEPSPSATAAAPVPRFIGPAEDGRTFAMTPGQTTTLRLTDPSAPEPEVEGAAVLLIPIANVADGGAREWEVRAVEPGDAVLRSAGEPPWTIAFIVAE